MQQKAEWVLSFFLLSCITFTNSLISSFCRRNGPFRSKTIWVYSISGKWKWRQKKITACFTFSFVSGRIILRECRPCTAKQGWGQSPFRLLNLARSLIFRCRFQCPDCSLSQCQLGTGMDLPDSFALLRQSWNLNLKLKVKNKVSKSIKPHYHSSGAFILFPAFWIIENCSQKIVPPLPQRLRGNFIKLHVSGESKAALLILVSEKMRGGGAPNLLRIAILSMGLNVARLFLALSWYSKEKGVVEKSGIENL